MAKYIFVTGGVVSSLGKGLVTASLGALLESRGLKVSLTKLDPYLNVDAGTMNPFQHGEVYVTDDGAECDLDLGHYERFVSTRCNNTNSLTSGRIYGNVIQKERRGDYLGATVQVVPHVTDEIMSLIESSGEGADVAIIEIGGTIGDIESLPFVEAIRQMRIRVGDQNSIFVHLTLLPYVSASEEIKTKPTQHSVMQLRSIGIQPDVLICRSEIEYADSVRKKIALFTNVSEEAIVPDLDIDTVYRLPIVFHQHKLDDVVLRKLGLSAPEANLKFWEEFIEALESPTAEVTIGIVGKYVELPEAYKSLNEALTHAGAYTRTAINVQYVNAEDIETQGTDQLENLNGIIVPGGFGERGIEGMILTAQYARENHVPYLGICLGLHVAVIEIARNVLGLQGAYSTEFDSNAKDPVIALVTEWQSNKGKIEKRSIDDDLGGTMRLGAQKCILETDSLAYSMYGEREIEERHRHRYEVNSDYLPELKKILKVSGLSRDTELVETIEIPDHPWFFCCQFHPELLSTPRGGGHRLFNSLAQASRKHKAAID